MQWIIVFHLVFGIAWFAGLFYLPRLFVYHANTTDRTSLERFKRMEARLYYAITLPAAVGTTLLGLVYVHTHLDTYLHANWLHLKLTLVFFLWIYQLICWKYLRAFKKESNPHSSLYYRVFNEVPTVLLIGIISLVVIQPKF